MQPVLKTYQMVFKRVCTEDLFFLFNEHGEINIKGKFSALWIVIITYNS